LELKEHFGLKGDHMAVKENKLEEQLIYRGLLVMKEKKI
jgi:hypothetical protein